MTALACAQKNLISQMFYKFKKNNHIPNHNIHREWMCVLPLAKGNQLHHLKAHEVQEQLFEWQDHLQVY